MQELYKAVCIGSFLLLVLLYDQMMTHAIIFSLTLSDHQWRTMSVPDRSLQIGGGEPNMANIESMRNHSELFRAECLRLISDAGKQCKRMQNEEQQLGKSERNQLGFAMAEGNAANPWKSTATCFCRSAA